MTHISTRDYTAFLSPAIKDACISIILVGSIWQSHQSSLQEIKSVSSGVKELEHNKKRASSTYADEVHPLPQRCH
jgi:hypothetical protein